MPIENAGFEPQVETLNGIASHLEATSAQASDEIRLVDILLVVAHNRRMIMTAVFFTAVATALISLLLPNIYTATARILPPQQGQSTVSMLLGQLGGLGSLAGKDLGAKSPSAIYVGMLNSRTVSDELIRRFDLNAIYRTPRMSDARSTLADASQISVEADGLISISVDATDPKLATNLANGYVEELRKLTSTLSITEASQRRLFFEQQLKAAKDDMSKAEEALKTTQERTGLIELGTQPRMIIESVGMIRAEVAAKQVELRSVQSFATAQNPYVVRIKEEIAALQSQLAELERPHVGKEGDIQVPTGNVPSVGLEYIRKYRDVKYYETLYEIIAKQYEAARIDEAKDSGVVQILDPAVIPDKRSKPKRSILVLLAGMLAGILATIYAFVKTALQKAVQDPEESSRWDELKKYLRRPSLLPTRRT